MTKKSLFASVSEVFVAGAVMAGAIATGVGCGDDHGDVPPDPDPDPQAELQALLRDAPLVQAPPAATGTIDPSSARFEPALTASGPPVGRWELDDCSTSRTELRDSSFSGNTAFRSVGASCATGRVGAGVELTSKQDIVYVPDQPAFTFERGVTVAGWFQPESVEGTRTLVRKRDGDTSSFALLIHAGKFQLVANLGPDRAISVRSPQPAEAGRFQHVAGTYDGSALRLYLDGSQVAFTEATGAIARGPGPLLLGNDGSERRLDGVLDIALFATHAFTADEIQALTCFPELPSVAISPRPTPPAPPGQPVAFDVAVTNNNPAACAPITFSMRTLFPFNATVDPPPFTTRLTTVASGETGHFAVTATASAAAEPGTQASFTIHVAEATSEFFTFETVSFEIAASTACQVSTDRELMIKRTSVVDDPVRTAFDEASADPRNGVWTFKHLVEEMAPTPADAPAMVEAMLATFTSEQTINGFTVAARPNMRSAVLDSWPRTAGGELDLARAPFRLQAIVNRIDLRDLASGDAGEGRFVFAFHPPDSFAPLQATIIFEYKLPAATDQDVLDWAQGFHALGGLAAGEPYNAALQELTERFARRGARPGRPNGSAINAVRTNEIPFGDNGLWELRQFGLSAVTGRLEPTTVERTPAGAFNASATLASYIDANQAAILAERHVVPERFDDQPFAAGAIFNDLGTWFASGVDSEARHRFAINTCNGCHSQAETGTVFLQIEPRLAGAEARLSPFLTGVTVGDPATGTSRTFNELARRRADLQAIVCAEPGLAATTGAARARLRKGVSRVH